MRSPTHQTSAIQMSCPAGWPANSERIALTMAVTGWFSANQRTAPGIVSVGANAELTTHMKSVGEAMAMGRTFGQAFLKAMRSRELDKVPDLAGWDLEALLDDLGTASPERFDVLLEAFRRGATIEDVHGRTSIDPWYLRELQAVALDPDAPFAGERTFRSVDTCAAEFPAQTPYFYSGWERRAAHELGGGARRGPGGLE